uniref:Rad21/Rec8-like protein N-terminal domain-containing protein n=1 Tax=Setaria digitata TaxID=48799 RepID=A0A915PU82_9BILA
MFYAQFVLSKKGPLAKIWLAAHWEKKLSKAQIYETNVQDAVDEILKPKVKMALRTTGHLLLGIVRIYSRKAKYLLADCNEAFLKIKMAFRPGQVELDEDGQQATSAAINLPEVFHDFDAALPDFNELDMHTQIHINQSRIDDITLKEDLIPEATDMPFGAEFGGDDFGESSLGLFSDTNIEEARERISYVPEGGISRSGATLLEESQLGSEKSDAINGKAMEVDIADHLGMPMPDDDFGDFPADNMLDEVIFNESELARSLDAMEAPGAEHDIPMETEDVAATAIAGLVIPTTGGLASESFTLEPLDAATVAVAGIEKPGRPKRRRRLIVDEQKNISGDEMKGNMAEYRDTLQPLDLAPPTRKLMKLKETGTADKLFANPGCAHLRAQNLLKLYRSHLVYRVHSASALTGDQIRKDLEMAENVDDNIEPEGSIVSGLLEDRIDDFDDVGMAAMSPDETIGQLEAIPEEEVPIIPEEHITSLAKDVFASPERKKERKSRVERTMEEDETGADGEDEHRWTKRTQNVLNSIATKIKASVDGKILFTDLLTKGSTRKTAAQKFSMLLVLKKWQAIDLHQAEPYGEIVISAGPNITSTVSS